jgi:hypothetical protein
MLSMIVNYTQTGWEIVSQRNHGLLAAQICAHWKISQRPFRWIDTLIATAEHDDANNEMEKEELLELHGGPMNFQMVAFETGYCENLLNKALTKGRYVGLLIARHIQFLYGELPEAKSYCDNLQKQEKDWLKICGAKKEDLDASYRLLEFCDAFSLLLCQNHIPPEQRTTEISNGPDGSVYNLRQDDYQRLVVSPWPFEPEEFKVHYEKRIFDQLAYADTEAFRKAFKEAPVTTVEWIIAKK